MNSCEFYFGFKGKDLCSTPMINLDSGFFLNDYSSVRLFVDYYNII
jgi:hypothetical protein